MSGYISKEDALKALCSTCGEDVSTCGLCVEYSTIAKVCSADVKPVVRGEWICIDDDRNIWMCSACEDEQILEAGTPRDNNWNLCPNCGADMRDVEYTRNFVEFDTLVDEKRPIPADMTERSKTNERNL